MEEIGGKRMRSITDRLQMDKRVVDEDFEESEEEAAEKKNVNKYNRLCEEIGGIMLDRGQHIDHLEFITTFLILEPVMSMLQHVLAVHMGKQTFESLNNSFSKMGAPITEKELYELTFLEILAAYEHIFETGEIIPEEDLIKNLLQIGKDALVSKHKLTPEQMRIREDQLIQTISNLAQQLFEGNPMKDINDIVEKLHNPDIDYTYINSIIQDDKKLKISRKLISTIKEHHYNFARIRDILPISVPMMNELEKNLSNLEKILKALRSGSNVIEFLIRLEDPIQIQKNFPQTDKAKEMIENVRRVFKKVLVFEEETVFPKDSKLKLSEVKFKKDIINECKMCGTKSVYDTKIECSVCNERMCNIGLDEPSVNSAIPDLKNQMQSNIQQQNQKAHEDNISEQLNETQNQATIPVYLPSNMLITDVVDPNLLHNLQSQSLSLLQLNGAQYQKQLGMINPVDLPSDMDITKEIDPNLLHKSQDKKLGLPQSTKVQYQDQKRSSLTDSGPVISNFQNEVPESNDSATRTNNGNRSLLRETADEECENEKEAEGQDIHEENKEKSQSIDLQVDLPRNILNVSLLDNHSQSQSTSSVRFMDKLQKCTSSGQTPLMVARDCGHDETVKIPQEAKEIWDYPPEEHLGNGKYRVGKIFYDSRKKKGYGTNGTIVYEGCLDDGRKIAVKKIHRHHFNKKEVDALVNCPKNVNVVQYFFSEQCNEYVYIAMEKCDHTLHDYMRMDQKRRRQYLPNKTPLDVSREVLKGLDYLHKRGIVHRDLKPSNILMKYEKETDNVCILISDFGVSKMLGDGYKSCTLTGKRGTEGWIAKEALQGTGRFNRMVDVFTVGCLIHYILTDGKHPFGDKDREKYIRKNKPVGFDKTLDPLSQSFLMNMLAEKPKERPTVAAALAHPVFWDDEKRLDFLLDVHNRVKWDSGLIRKMKRSRIDVCDNWTNVIDPGILTTLIEYQKKHNTVPYESSSVISLFRAFRNLKEHCLKKFENIHGNFLKYWMKRFPRLLLHSYETFDCCKTESTFSKYYDKDYSFLEISSYSQRTGSSAKIKEREEREKKRKKDEEQKTKKDKSRSQSRGRKDRIREKNSRRRTRTPSRDRTYRRRSSSRDRYRRGSDYQSRRSHSRIRYERERKSSRKSRSRSRERHKHI